MAIPNTYYNEFVMYLTTERRYSHHTIRAYSDDITQFFDFMELTYGMLPITEIKASLIRSWLSTLKEQQNTAKTINRKISTLKTYFKYLQIKQIIVTSPLQHIISPKISKRLPQFVAEADIKTLLQEVEFAPEFEGQLHRVILYIFYYTGMRLSELQQLQLTNIDLQSNTLKVLGKGNKERLLPIQQALQNALTNYTLQRATLPIIIDTNYLLLTINGKKLYAKYIYNVVTQYLSKVTTISKKSPHILRHTFATHLTSNGAELNAVKELLGHSSLAATQIYTHNNIERLKNIHKKAHPKA